MDSGTGDHGAGRVIARIMERARARLVERGIDPADAFPARLVRDLAPSYGGKRMCLEAIYRAIARGHLEAVRIGREWFCDLESFGRWLDRRAAARGSDAVVDCAEAVDADALHAAVRDRLKRRRSASRSGSSRLSDS